MTSEADFRSGKGLAHFDYMAECDKTCSTVFKPEQVEVEDIRFVLRSIVGFCNDLNVIKKLLFRGKSREELGFTETTKPTMEDIGFLFSGKGAIDVLHGAVGVITESGEVAEYLLKWIDDGELDAVNVAEEAGDMLWYIVRSLRGIGINMDQCERMNIDKLRGRHGETFDVFRDANRNLNVEREKLSDMFEPTEVVRNPNVIDETTLAQSLAGGNPALAEQVEEIARSNRFYTPIAQSVLADGYSSKLIDDVDPASRDKNEPIHEEGVAKLKEAHGERQDMFDKIKATNNADLAPPVRTGPIGDCEGMDC